MDLYFLHFNNSAEKIKKQDAIELEPNRRGGTEVGNWLPKEKRPDIFRIDTANEKLSNLQADNDFVLISMGAVENMREAFLMGVPVV